MNLCFYFLSTLSILNLEEYWYKFLFCYKCIFKWERTFCYVFTKKYLVCASIHFYWQILNILMSKPSHLIPNSALQINYTSFSTPSIYFLKNLCELESLRTLCLQYHWAVASPTLDKLWQHHLYYFENLSMCHF